MDAASYKAGVTEVFNQAAARYDQAGVEFFTPMGKRLVELVRPQSGGRLLDVGCGLGACVFPAAEAVGPNGKVVGIDIASAMVSEARREASRLGVNNVELLVMDAEKPEFEQTAFDAIIGSFSIIFLPDSFNALAKFRKLLAPGGRLGFTSPVFTPGTFPFLPPLFTEIITDEILKHVPDEWHPHRLVDRLYRWLIDPGELARTLTRAGFGEVVSQDEPVRMVANSGSDWVAWSHTQGMRLLWNNLPARQQRYLREAIIGKLDSLRSADGLITLEMPVRYVVAEASAR
jgi:O-methyltransferase / aklanonic acid methyltransferase